MEESLLPTIKTNTSVTNINNGKEIPELEQIALIVERTMSRYGGQMVKSSEATNRSQLELSHKTITLLEQSIATDSYLAQDITSLKQAVIDYSVIVNQITEYLTKQHPTNTNNSDGTNNSTNSNAVTKEQLNQAIQFLASKIATLITTNDFALLTEKLNRMNALLTDHIATNQNDSQNSSQSNSQNNSLQVIINQLSALQKQQQSQQIQIQQVLSYLASEDKEQAIAGNNPSSGNGNNKGNNSNNATTTPTIVNIILSKLSSRFSSQVKAITANSTNHHNNQQNSNNQLEEKYHSIPGTPYQISAKALKQIALVLIGIVVLAIIFK